MLLNDMAPYLLLGFGVAGILSIVVTKEQIQDKIGSKNIYSNIKAVLYGIPLPLCSCGVIPVAASLKKKGASKGAIISFLTATPQTGIDSIMITYGMLGLPILVLKLSVALISGILSGIAANILDSFSNNNEEMSFEDECCNEKKENTLKRVFIYGFRTLPKDIAEPLLLGIILAAIIGLIGQNFNFIKDIPVTFLGSVFKILVIMVISIPLYVCATASVPLALMIAVMLQSPGAAIALLIAGPATNISTILACIKMIGKKSTAIYVITIFIFALISGILADNIEVFRNSIPNDMPHIHHDHISIFSLVCVFILLAVLFIALIHKKTPNEASNSIIINVKGMTCSHCESNVERGLLSLPGIDSVVADHKTGKVAVDLSSKISNQRIYDVIESYNYRVVLDD
ncbi:MAG: hypothetical protein CBD97_03765 [Pelagibacteraceae bacterium TMED237]|nr:hypothetical protein [Candidatus Neomarinimicrobiota bacterium]OUW95030.1 MAG: hypothetical protein CBD97_03765 [Pelagibacteraceae bacterium TMED237]